MPLLLWAINQSANIYDVISFLSHLQGFGWMLGGTPWDTVKGAWPAPSPPLGWPFKSCQMKSSGDCCFPTLSLKHSSVLAPSTPTSFLSSSAAHALPAHAHTDTRPEPAFPQPASACPYKLRMRDPRLAPQWPHPLWSTLPPCVYPVSGLAHQWETERERVWKERRAIASLFRPPLLSQRFEWTRVTRGAAADALVLEVPNTFFWNIPFHAKKGFLLSHPAPHPSCARPPPAQTRALSGLPGVPPSIISRPERKCWCYTMLIKFPSMHSSQRQSGVIKGGTDYSGSGSRWTTSGVTKKRKTQRERDKENEFWRKRVTLDWKIEQNKRANGSEGGREDMTLKKAWERELGLFSSCLHGYGSSEFICSRAHTSLSGSSADGADRSLGDARVVYHSLSLCPFVFNLRGAHSPPSHIPCRLPGATVLSAFALACDSG